MHGSPLSGQGMYRGPFRLSLGDSRATDGRVTEFEGKIT